jgi:hypothetical protein
MIFKSDGFNWERVVEEYKVLSWRVISSKSKGFRYPVSQWLLNPTGCLEFVENW